MPFALISVSNKNGAVEAAKRLVALGYTILSTGGTYRVLHEAGIEAVQVSWYTGHPEVMDGRVKTLHPKVHGGILGIRDNETHVAEAKANGIEWIDVVIVNLYPFEATIAQKDVAFEEAIEQVDIGGPAMVRAAAKNHAHVLVVTDPEDYDPVLALLERNAADITLRRALARKAFEHTARYDAVISQWLGTRVPPFPTDDPPRELALPLAIELVLRYGQNAPQKAELYAFGDHPLAFRHLAHVDGSGPGFINVTDYDGLVRTLIQIAAHFEANGLPIPRIAVGGKHGNACGVGVDKDSIAALEKMLDSDPDSITGGTVVCNFAIGDGEARTLRHHATTGRKRVLDNIVCAACPSSVPGILARQDGKYRIYVNPRLGDVGLAMLPKAHRYREVLGGMLREEPRQVVLRFDAEDLTLSRPLSPQQAKDMLVATAVNWTSSSNTITAVKDGKLLNAVGQQSRVRAARLLGLIAEECEHTLVDAVVASDSFFPFDDAPKILISQGIAALFVTKGGRNFAQVRQTIEDAGVLLVFGDDEKYRGFEKH